MGAGYSRRRDDANNNMRRMRHARWPEMSVVSIKSAEQQAVLSIHRARARLVNRWTVLCNQIRGLLTKFGFVLLVGPHQLRPRYVRGKRQAYCDFQDCRSFDICYTAKIIQVDQVILANYDKIS